MRADQPSPLTEHHATASRLPSRHGPLAALRARARTPRKAVALLLPGYTGSKEDFAPLLDPLADAGFDTTAVDLPGQYESPGPDDESCYLPRPLGDLVAELVGKLAADGDRVLLLGHSYGGLVARGAVLAGCPIAGLTLMDSGPSAIADPVRLAAMDTLAPILREHGVEAAWRARVAGIEAEPWYAGVPQPLKDFQHERFVRSTPAGLLGMAEGLRYEEDQVAGLAKALSAQAAPCLVVCGEQDDAWPVDVQRDMAERLDVDLAVLPDSAHSPNTENPQALLGTLIATWNAWLAG